MPQESQGGGSDQERRQALTQQDARTRLKGMGEHHINLHVCLERFGAQRKYIAAELRTGQAECMSAC